MADLTFNTTPGEPAARHHMIAYLNVGEASDPEWAPFGKRVEESSLEYDWGQETSRDVLNNVYTRLQAPTITQTFEPCALDSADPAVLKIWNLGVREHNVQALANRDMMIAHFYVNASTGEEVLSRWAERYESCAVVPTSLGGAGGGNLEMGVDITYGGNRTLGSVTNSDNTITFTPDVTV